MTRSVRFRSGQPRAALVPILLAVSAAGLGSACGNRIVPLRPTGNPATVAIAIESFIGVVPVKGSRFYSFTVPQDGIVSLTLLSLVEAGEPSAALVNVAIGVPRATDCQVVESRTTGPDAKPLIRDSFPAGVYCVRITDVDSLTADASFAINITRPR